MTKDEAERQIKIARDRVSALQGEMSAANRALYKVVADCGLIILDMKAGDVLRCKGKLYSVVGAKMGIFGGIKPAARLIKKDGTLSERELPDFGDWEREDAE